MRILKFIGDTLFFSPRGWNYAEWGQTLIEVLLAVGVTTVLLVSMMAVVTRSISNSQFSKNKAVSGQYVQAGLEKARSFRDQASWTDFKDSYPDGEYTGFPAPSPFTRIIDFTPDGDNKRKVTVTVTWTDGKGTHTSQGVTYLTDWE